MPLLEKLIATETATQLQDLVLESCLDDHVEAEYHACFERYDHLQCVFNLGRVVLEMVDRQTQAVTKRQTGLVVAMRYTSAQIVQQTDYLFMEIEDEKIIKVCVVDPTMIQGFNYPPDSKPH